MIQKKKKLRLSACVSLGATHNLSLQPSSLRFGSKTWHSKSCWSIIWSSSFDMPVSNLIACPCCCPLHTQSTHPFQSLVLVLDLDLHLVLVLDLILDLVLVLVLESLCSGGCDDWLPQSGGGLKQKLCLGINGTRRQTLIQNVEATFQSIQFSCQLLLNPKKNPKMHRFVKTNVWEVCQIAQNFLINNVN